MKINTNLVKAKWFDHPEDPEIQIKIRPFPMSEGMYIPGTDDNLMSFAWKKFNYSLIDWKGFEDQDGNPLECNKENKKFIFDYFSDLMMWVSNEITSMTNNLSAQKKT